MRDKEAMMVPNALIRVNVANNEFAVTQDRATPAPSCEPAHAATRQPRRMRTAIRGGTHIIGRYEPGHLGAGRQLAVDQTLDLALRPPVVDVHDGYGVPPVVLEPLAAHLHGGQHEAITHEVRRVAHALAGFEAACCMPRMANVPSAVCGSRRRLQFRADTRPMGSS
ncbi:hypothetical protein EVAR_77237_1 [Eumeta japonica]|uniref:Uncharacterized protein n=1 Tax=Eumeta variegata TaxID=151549 RepID=A0A4C1ZYC9_EUMVA|nr:hypothetical protein EVAR_77237_1 [Eumeta japonica]